MRIPYNKIEIVLVTIVLTRVNFTTLSMKRQVSYLLFSSTFFFRLPYIEINRIGLHQRNETKKKTSSLFTEMVLIVSNYHFIDSFVLDMRKEQESLQEFLF